MIHCHHAMHASRLFAAALLVTAPLCAEEEEKVETEVTVQVAKVVKATLHRRITAYGTVEAHPGDKDQPPAGAKITAAVAGIISEINAVEGQEVKKGDILFKLDSRAADAAVSKSRQAVEFAQKNVERQEKLISSGGTSDKLVLEARQVLSAANADLAAAEVAQALLIGQAPCSGTLVKFDAKPGEAADVTKVLAEIVDMDRLVATVRVPRAEIAAVKEKQHTRIQEEVEGEVAYIGKSVDPVSDTIAVRVSVPKDSGLRPGEFVTARIGVEEHADKLAVPESAVYTDGEGKSTLSIVEGDTAKKHGVKTGFHDGELIEVEGEGLKEGTLVVTEGSYALPEETKVVIEEEEKEGGEEKEAKKEEEEKEPGGKAGAPQDSKNPKADEK